MLSNDQLNFLKGVVTDSGYPYYVVYPEPFDANNSLIHIYLSASPVEVNGSTFEIDNGVYLQMHHDNYITEIGRGDYTFTIPVADSMCYTSTSNTPLYPSIFQSSANISYDVGINYRLLFFAVLMACIVGGAVSRLLFGGGKL